MLNLEKALSDLADMVEHVVTQTLKNAGIEDLTPQQLHCLQVIIRLKNPTVSELAAELGLTKPAVTVLVDKLENKAYIKRIPSHQDRRIIHLHTDDKAERIIQLKRLAIEHIQERIIASLNESEIALLTQLLGKFIPKS